MPVEKTYDPKKIEKKHYDLWERNGSFSVDREQSKEPYTIVIPPPNITGSLHMGHALNNTLQDILIRFERMRGKAALWQPGTDHAGIATQMVVERMLEADGLSRTQLGRDEFIKKIWQWKNESGGTIVNQLKRLGASADWSRERFTMDKGLSNAVTKVFVDLYKNGLIYKDKRLVNWDPKLHTAISDLEVENRDVNGKLWHINYPIKGEDKVYITVATTRPETMLGDTAVAVNPKDERFNSLIGKKAILPLVGRTIPIIGDDYADMERGSGAVKITPGHDFNDFEVSKRHSLEIINIFDENAYLNENVPNGFQKLERFKARELIVNLLEEKDLIAKIETIEHTVPYGDRSGVIIEPKLTDQWYVDAKKLAVPAVEIVTKGKVEFVPKQWEKTFFEWMKNIEPWCVSRQLWWGHQIPAWYGPDGEIFVENNEEKATEVATEYYGKKNKLVRDEDVLDTWFSSALWPFSTLGWPEKTNELIKHYPTNTLVTGFDIIFFWVARMLMMSMYFMEDTPFKKVYVHALVRDEKGQKMSKSKGNIIDPLDLINNYGADALRFTLAAMAAQGRDIKLSKNRVEGYRNFATKLWNAVRFTEINECKLNANYKPGNSKNTIILWITSELVKMIEETTNSIESFKFNEAAEKVYQFTWHTFCDWYLEFIKPIFYNGNKELIKETQDSTAWILDQILKVLHPFMPFITEELHEKLYENSGIKIDRLITSNWPSLNSGLIDNESIKEIDWLIKVVTGIRSIRSELNLSPVLEIESFVLSDNSKVLQRLNSNRTNLIRLAHLKSIDIIDEEREGTIKFSVDDSLVMIPITKIIDIKSERNRLNKEIGKLGKEIEQIEKKLSNKNFISKAPSDVVDKQKIRKENYEKNINKLISSLSKLEKIG